jgi:octanoyl-[GcvH]:protein N-octanoyltransferase
VTRASGTLADLAGGPLRLCLDDVDADPALDTATSRAILQRVDAGELPATLRLSRPRRILAFSARDARTGGFDAAVAAARAGGFTPVLRLAGGRAAVFTPDTIAFAWAVPSPTPGDDIEPRFALMASALRAAFRALGADARVGEVPGEYCPGSWSINAGGRRKLAGIGQRLLRRSAHTGGVVVVDDAAAINAALTPVHAAMGVPWDPAATGAVADEVGGVDWATVRDAIVEAFADRGELEPWSLDDATRRLAEELAPRHRIA